MFGNLFGSVFEIATLPLDAVNAAFDIASGGDGSKESRIDCPLTGDVERVRDIVAEAAKGIDNE